MKGLLLSICCLAVMFAACDRKEILPGKRESIAGIIETNKFDKSVINSSERISASLASTLSSHIDIAGNKQHNSINYKLTQDPKLLWKTSLKGAQVNSDPIAFDGKIFIVNSRGDLLCISQNDGKNLWEVKVAKQPDGATFSGGMTADGSVIYVATNIGDVVAVDVNSQKTIWKKSLKYPLRGAPLVASGKLIVNSIDGQTFALNTSEGDIVWKKTNTSELTVMAESATPALFGNDIICAYGSGDLKSLDLISGNDSWTDVLFSTNIADSGAVISHIAASPVVSGNKVLAATSESKMVMFDASSGIRVWEKDIGTINIPVINSGWIFVLSGDRSVLCLSEADGSVKWTSDIRDLYPENKYPKNAEFVGPLLINGDVVIFSDHGDILKLDISTGKLKSIYNFSGMSTCRTPIVVGDKLFAVTSRADLYAIG